MPLPTSGTITIANIADEFGGTVPHNLSEYYRGGGLVPNISANTSIPTSGTISLSNFYGTTAKVCYLIRYGSNTNDDGTAIATDSSGNFYITGNDFVVSRFNADGTISWQVAFNAIIGSTTFAGYGIATSSTSVYAVGSNPNNATDAIMVRYNLAGIFQWAARVSDIGNARFETFNGAATDSSGNLYVVGTYSTTSLTTGRQLFISKVASSSAVLWQRFLGIASTSDNGYAIDVDSLDNVYVTGDLGTNTSAIVTAKFDTNGTFQWQRVLDFGTADSDTGYGIGVDGSNNAYVVGAYGPFSLKNLFLLKYNSSGVLQWSRFLGGLANGNTYGQSIAVSSSGNCYISGYNVGSGSGILVKYDSAGTLQWQRRVRYGSNNAFFSGSAIDSSEDQFFVGRSITGFGGNDIVIGKIPSDGTRTGTYGSWSYLATSIPSGTVTFTTITPSVVTGTASITSASAGISAGSISFSYEKTNI